MRRGRGERVAGRVLTAAAVVFLVAWAWPILDPGLDPRLVLVCRVVLGAVWALFVGDYVVRLVRAGDRREFASRHLLDLLVLVFPVLRQLELVRLVALVLVVNRRASADLRGRVAVHLAGGALLLGVVGSLAVLDAERGAPGAGITSFGDAAWWTVTTMSTVGYGDLYPVTVLGRGVAVVLMLGGVGVLGLVTALLASWLVEAVAARGGRDPAAEVAAPRAQVAELTEQLRRREDARPGPPDRGAGGEDPPGPGTVVRGPAD
ncbi:potassium channel family protein [Kocuria rosea]|uniref:potassium channel family protein n=1 Tax=Kocuria rosea TaxID=1275 RepID=UPI0025417E14|nr:potassium channel family protein [Kocuria rosea]WIG18901.1 potassium channel family protein [Kocuria rosea]